jgi:hypothetical protein
MYNIKKILEADVIPTNDDLVKYKKSAVVWMNQLIDLLKMIVQ